MKRTQLINRHMSALVARLGHMDEIVVADAGLPTPNGVLVIDLSLRPGQPDLHQVLDVLRSELIIEAAIWANESGPEAAIAMQQEFDRWAKDTEKPITITTLPHEEFKHRSAGAKAIIRTGEITPYANVILVSGAAF